MSVRVLVTGAASGIGAAAAEQLRARGATVAGLDRAPGAGIVTCDIRDQGAVDRAVAEAIERLGIVEGAPVEVSADGATVRATARLRSATPAGSVFLEEATAQEPAGALLNGAPRLVEVVPARAGIASSLREHREEPGG